MMELKLKSCIRNLAVSHPILFDPQNKSTCQIQSHVDDDEIVLKKYSVYKDPLSLAPG